MPDDTEAETPRPWRTWAGLVLAPVLFVVLLLLPIGGLSVSAHRLLAVLGAVITLWISEAVPLPVTALFGPVLCVLLGIASVKDAFRGFADPIIFLFLGGFLLAEAMLYHGLNRRIAFSLLSRGWVSRTPARLIAGFGAATAMISLWVSNTATAAMMFPIALAVLKERGDPDPAFSARLMLTVAFAASLGGFGTPVGTPPNLIGLGLIKSTLGVQITFFQWMTFGLPLVIILMALLTMLLTRGLRESQWSQGVLAQQRAGLGPISAGERNVLLAFGVTVALWVGPGVIALANGTEDPVFKWLSAHVPESTAALTGALLLFFLPVNLREGRFTLTWREARNVEWGVILLFGGGLALGELMFSTGLARWLGESVSHALGTKTQFGLVTLFAAVAVVMSNATSNTASAAMIVPVAIAVAQGAGVPPLQPALAACLGSSLGLMLPVSTPPNAIVYGSGCVPLLQMVRFGLTLDLLGTVVVVAVVMWLVPLVVK